MTGTAHTAHSTHHARRGSWRFAVGATVAALTRQAKPFPFHPLLVATYPTLVAYSDNLPEVSRSEVVHPILVGIGVALLLMLSIGALVRDLRKGALVASIVVMVWFGWQLLLEMMVGVGLTPMIGGAVIIWVVTVGLVGALWLRGRHIAAMTSACNVISIVLVALVVAKVAPHELRAASSPLPIDSRPVPDLGSRDVWFLVFDRYGNQEAMQDAADVVNDLPGWLEQHGFAVADGARANYGRTALSLSATLNMTYLDELASRMGAHSSDSQPLTDMIQDNDVGRFFQSIGYRFVQVGSWFGPTKTSAIADDNPVMSGRSAFGYLLYNMSLMPLIKATAGIDEPPGQELMHREAGLFGWEQLRRVASEPGPKFVFGHVLLPHEPYVFTADGSYAELSEIDARYSHDAHQQQLAYTNTHIRDLVSTLLDVPPDDQPIIIVSADEGPYPDRYQADQDGFDWATATDDELAMKYGVLLAMYLPDGGADGAPEPYSDMSLVNVFPIVLDRYFGGHVPLLADRSFTSRSWPQPYDLTEVTDRLRAAMP